MSKFLFFNYFFESRNQRIARLAEASQYEKLQELGVEPVHLEWFMHGGHGTTSKKLDIPEFQPSSTQAQTIESA